MCQNCVAFFGLAQRNIDGDAAVAACSVWGDSLSRELESETHNNRLRGWSSCGHVDFRHGKRENVVVEAPLFRKQKPTSLVITQKSRHG